MVSPGASSFGPSSGSAQPDALQRWLTTGALIGAAALVGFGIIVWIAANWDDFGRFGRFTLVGSAILASSVAAATVPAARVPGSLAGMLGIGGLLALVGQTYQTGADPWQLFALWAGLSLPWAIAARHDAVWCLWVVVVFTALPLWMLAQTDRLWRLAMDVALPAWLAGIAVVAVLCPNFALERWLGRTHWSFRLAAALALVLVTSGALGNLFNSNGAHPVYWAGLMLTAAAAAAFAVSAPFDLALLAAATLALDVLLIGGAVRAILDGSSGANEVGRLLSIGLFSAGIVAASAVVLLRIARQRHLATPDGETTVSGAQRTWPVAVLSGIGALLAAVPLLGFLFTAFGAFLQKGAGTYVLGLAILAATVLVLRLSKPLSFAQQFGVIALAIGGLMVGLGAYRDLPVGAASLGLAVLTAVLALAIPVAWVRGLLGAAAAALMAVLIAQVLVPDRHLQYFAAFRLAWVLVAIAGAAALLAAADAGAAAGDSLVRQFTRPFATGWSVAGLIGLMAAAGPTFLLGTSMGLGSAGLGTEPGDVALWNATRVLSVAAALAGCGLLLTQRPALGTPVGTAIGLVAIVLAGFTPCLGAAVLTLAAALLAGRRSLAILAAFACLWVIGSFYYWLGWPLLHKAYLLMALGAGLGLVAVVSGVTRPDLGATTTSLPGLRPALAAALIGLSTVATAGTVGRGIWQMEDLLHTGRIIYLSMVPVDPRSLMQGDYMALRFALPSTPQVFEALQERTGALSVVATVDARNVATVVSVSNGQPALSSDQVRINLTRKAGQWRLGTDAWFFKEGNGERFAAARFGEFRVGSDGRALLVGLAQADLQPIR